MSLEIEDNKVGALADGFAASAINDTEIEEDSTGYVGGVANGDDRNNTDVDTDIELKSEVDVDTDIKNGDNRDNEYDWSYDSKVDTDVKQTTINDNDITTKSDDDFDWSYDSKVDNDNFTSNYSDNDSKTSSYSDNDSKTSNYSDDDSKTSADNNGDNRDNFSSQEIDTETNWGVLDDVKDFGNLGIAGHDLTFNIGDDFSFNLNIDNVLNGSISGSGFSIVQAHNIADQDAAYGVRMDNAGANNNLSANGGGAYADPGVDLDGKGWDKGWDLDAGDDVNGSSVADASAILANSGFHLEVVQGASMLSNSVDITVTGGNSNISDVGEDTGS